MIRKCALCESELSEQYGKRYIVCFTCRQSQNFMQARKEIESPYRYDILATTAAADKLNETIERLQELWGYWNERLFELNREIDSRTVDRLTTKQEGND